MTLICSVSRGLPRSGLPKQVFTCSHVPLLGPLPVRVAKVRPTCLAHVLFRRRLKVGPSNALPRFGQESRVPHTRPCYFSSALLPSLKEPGLQRRHIGCPTKKWRKNLLERKKKNSPTAALAKARGRIEFVTPCRRGVVTAPLTTCDDDKVVLKWVGKKAFPPLSLSLYCMGQGARFCKTAWKWVVLSQVYVTFNAVLGGIWRKIARILPKTFFSLAKSMWG